MYRDLKLNRISREHTKQKQYRLFIIRIMLKRQYCYIPENRKRFKSLWYFLSSVVNSVHKLHKTQASQFCVPNLDRLLFFFFFSRWGEWSRSPRLDTISNTFFVKTSLVWQKPLIFWQMPLVIFFSSYFTGKVQLTSENLFGNKEGTHLFSLLLRKYHRVQFL